MLKFPVGSVFLDVGANLGLASLPVAAAGYRVVAIEPVRETFEILCNSIAINGFSELIVPLHAAAHEQNTKLPVFVPNGRPDNTSLSEEASTGNVGGAAVPEWIETVIHDDWLRQHHEIRDSVRFVKIDVQGGEIHVLRGLREFLRERRGKIRVECEFDRHLLRLSGKSESEMLELMRDLRYSCRLGDRLIGPGDWSSLPDCDLTFE
jgi:FkbM family methyltransferase